MLKQSLKRLFFLLIAVLATACGSDDGATDNPDSGSTGGGVTGGQTGGTLAGGATTGGMSAGGTVTGGVTTGGAVTGGMVTGGSMTGGAPTGGMATGGNPSGGAMTGGTMMGDPFAGLPSGRLPGRLQASREVARIPASDAPMGDSESVLSVATGATITAYDWTVTEAETGQEVMTSTEATPTFTCPADGRGAYDVNVRLTDGTVVSTYHERRLVTCTLPRTDAGRTVISVDLDQSSYFQEGEINGTAVAPGTLIRVRGAISKNFVFFNFNGTADQPIHIINEGLVTNTDASWLLHLTNCRHVIVDGLGDDNHDYGFVLDNSTANGSQAVWVRFYTQGNNTIAAPTDIEIFGVHVARTPGTGLQVSTDGSAAFNRSNWMFEDLRIHHVKIEDVGKEGFYIGYFTDGVDPPPFKMHRSRIYRNELARCGWDCLQFSNSVDLEVHHNVSRDSGLSNENNQRSALQVNSGNVDAAFYNNRIIGAPGGIDVQVGCSGGDMLFYGNVIEAARGMYLHGGASNGPHIRVFHNTLSYTSGDGDEIVRVNKNSAPMSCQGMGTTVSAVDVTHNLGLVDAGAGALRIVAGDGDMTGWTLAPNLLAEPNNRMLLCLSASSDTWPLRPTCETSTALTPDGDVLSTLGLMPSDVPGGVVTDVTGRVLDGPRGHGAYGEWQP